MRTPTHAAFPFLVLSSPIDFGSLPAQIQQKLQEFQSGAPAAPAMASHQRILGGGNKGGTGKTTVLIEMATRFHQLGIRTLFLDISAACNIAVRLHLQEAVSYQPFPLDEAGQHILLHGTGVSVLALPHYFRLQPAEVEGLLGALQQTYPTVFIDGDQLRLYPYIPQVDRTLIVASSASLQDNLALLKEASLNLRNSILVLNQLTQEELAGIEEVPEVEGFPLYGLPYQEELPINMELGLTFTSRRASVPTPWFKHLDRLAQFLVRGVRLQMAMPAVEAASAIAGEIPAIAFSAPPPAEAPPAFTFQPPPAAPATEPAPAFSFRVPGPPPESAPQPSAETPPAFSFQPSPVAAPATEPAPAFSFRAPGPPAEPIAPPASEGTPAFSFQPSPAAAPAEPASSFTFKPMAVPAEPSPAEGASSFHFRSSASQTAIAPAAEPVEEIVEAATEGETPTKVFVLDESRAAGSLEEMAKDKELQAFAARAERADMLEQMQRPEEPAPIELGEEFFPADPGLTSSPVEPPAPVEPELAPSPAALPRLQLADAPLQVVMAQIDPPVLLHPVDLMPPRVEVVVRDEPQTAVELLDVLVDTAPRRPVVVAGDHDRQPAASAAGEILLGKRTGPVPCLPERPSLAALERVHLRHFNTFKVKSRTK